jgi:nitroimidazol reductase NimA-like FMN-containing flavoprotein (pyridoxamine 5'-phosphate oxidase superfamily)
LQRLPKRGAHDFATIAAILDEGFFCHVGFVAGGQPYVIPTGYGRKGRTLYIHGSFASRMLNELATGIPMCLTVTLADGLVLARSGFHSSVNYRSVVVLGTATVVEGEEKGAALEIISEQILPGRWADIRWPNRKELKATIVLKLRINEASAKIRTGPPKDDEEDYALTCWAGILPLKLTPGEPVADPRLPHDIPVPAYARTFPRPRGRK